MKKIGTICYATNSGLGILAKEFFDNDVVHEILVIKHPLLENFYHSWYPGARVTDINPPDQIVEEFVKNIDVLLLFETGFSNNICNIAKNNNVKVVLMPMYECSPLLNKPDALIAVSDLDYDYCKDLYPDIPVVRINVPAHSKINWKQRTIAKKFFHNAGNISFFDRNGTFALINAMSFVKSPIKLQIRCQNKDILPTDKIELLSKNMPFDEIWDENDCFIFVERYNGLSMPLQESFSAGCLVIAGNRKPVNSWLPKAPLVDPQNYQVHSIQPHLNFLCANYNPIEIAKKIDEFFETDITKFSLAGKVWGEENSWSNLRNVYKNLLENV